jgi:hypothetical protein
METTIWNFVSAIKDAVPIDVVSSEDCKEIEKGNPERVTIVYPATLTKEFHYFEYQGERIKYSAEIFKIDNSRQVVFESIPVACIKGSVLYLLFSTTDEAVKFIKNVLEMCLPSAISAAKEKIEHNFKVAFAAAIETRVTEYKSRVEENECDCEKKEQELLALRRQILTDKRALEALDGTKGQWKQKAESEYGHLLKLIPNFYARIVLDGEFLVAETYPVEIRFSRTTYDIGEFQIRIKLSTGDLAIKNTTHQIDGYDHPHISDEAACLGNIGPGVIKMLAEFELFGALQMIHSFLHSYNPSSPYKKIEFWDPEHEDEEENRYESCHDDNRGYNCVECGDDNCPFYQDAFQDCFEASTLDDCINCEYQCHLGRQRIQQQEEEKAEASTP